MTFDRSAKSSWASQAIILEFLVDIHSSTPCFSNNLHSRKCRSTLHVPCLHQQNPESRFHLPDSSFQEQAVCQFNQLAMIGRTLRGPESCAGNKLGPIREDWTVSRARFTNSLPECHLIVCLPQPFWNSSTQNRFKFLIPHSYPWHHVQSITTSLNCHFLLCSLWNILCVGTSL
jgi:hypothetical protein